MSAYDKASREVSSYSGRTHDPDRHLCAWRSTDGRRCQYAGSMSRETSNSCSNADAAYDLAYFCRHHFRCTNSTAGDEIVSQSYRAKPEPDQGAQLQSEANAWCAERGLHTVDQMRAACRAMSKTALKPMPRASSGDEWEEGRE
jgi:hypothetical protein